VVYDLTVLTTDDDDDDDDDDDRGRQNWYLGICSRSTVSLVPDHGYLAHLLLDCLLYSAFPSVTLSNICLLLFHHERLQMRVGGSLSLTVLSLEA